jgi:hypothetical protein
MLTIREEQMKVFREEQQQHFVMDLARHFREQLPDHYQALGDEGVRRAIWHGMETARSYGIFTGNGLLVFVRLMFVFGEHFDRESEWAAAVLRNSSTAEEQDIVSALAGAATAHLKQMIDVAGRRP